MLELLLRLAVLVSLPVHVTSEAVNQTSTTASASYDGGEVVASTIGPEWPASRVSATGLLSPTDSATCESRTVNYITHTLPQQCLRTERVTAGPGTQAEEITMSSSSTEHAESVASPSASDSHVSIATTSPEAAAPANTVAQSSSKGNDTSSSSTPLTGSTASESKAAESTVPESTPTSETENDSPLDNANFLSFEDWKKQNLAKAGQSPENLAQGRSGGGERQRPGISNALDTLGEESEIDLDFSGFVTGPMREAERPIEPESHSSESPESMPEGQDASALSSTLRSRDAGRICKERTNYASFDCAATVLKSNPECKSASSVLVENKDSYMLNICSAENKFFIIELCNDILIDTIVLANYEFFSSIFRQFRVSVSDRYPVKLDKWKDLGTFEARSTREVQAFLVENPLIWARYLRIEFLSQYGNEYYCPVSLLRVHGTTMMEEFRHQEEIAKGLADDEPAIEAEVAPPSIAQEPETSTDESLTPTMQSIPVVEDKVNDTGIAEAPNQTEAGPHAADQLEAKKSHPSQRNYSAVRQELLGQQDLGPSEVPSGEANDPSASFSVTEPKEYEHPITVPMSASSLTSNDQVPLTTTMSVPEPSVSTPKSSASAVNEGNELAQSQQVTTSQTSIATSSAVSMVSEATDMDGTFSPPPPLPDDKSTKQPEPSTAKPIKSTKPASSPSYPTQSQPQPSTQESFYKSIHKRLQQLESNSTLSLQYIEEQSRILRDAFSKVEKRQISATSNFLTHINSTVLTELQGFRTAYDQIWQSTVIELEGQREQYQREMLALSSRLTLVADELLWQKRLGIAQSTLLLLCLVLVLFARAGSGNLEIPLLQQMVHRSQLALKSGVGYGFDSEPHSPAVSDSRSPVSLFRRKIWRSSNGEGRAEGGSVVDEGDSRPGSKDGSTVGAVGAEMRFQPLASEIREEESDGEEDVADDEDEEYGEEDEAEKLKGTQSGPATPSGTRGAAKGPRGWPGSATEGVERASSPLQFD
ncbi:hypothetical protein MBLNU230_g2680t1 [Neophaeotheca triangularis]